MKVPGYYSNSNYNHADDDMTHCNGRPFRLYYRRESVLERFMIEGLSPINVLPSRLMNKQ